MFVFFQEIDMSHPQVPKSGTALVTGASSGIGKIYAERLAARGFDLILVARRQERLQTIARELRERFSVDADVLVADLADPDGLSLVATRLSADASISLLVNNAGFATLKPLAQTSDGCCHINPLSVSGA